MEMMSAVHPLETPVPARAVNQRDVLSLTLPPMPHLRVAFEVLLQEKRPKMPLSFTCGVSCPKSALIFLFVFSTRLPCLS